MQAIRGMYIFVLASLLVLTGCFGGGVIDDADGQTDENGNDGTTGTESSSTTIINNYYNNTTVVEDEIELFSSAGSSIWTSSSYQEVGDCESQNGEFAQNGILANMCLIPVKTISTQSGELLTLHEFPNDAHLDTTCSIGSTSVNFTSTGDTISGSALDCTHTIVSEQYTPNYARIWSIVYTITPVTVV